MRCELRFVSVSAHRRRLFFHLICGLSFEASEADALAEMLDSSCVVVCCAVVAAVLLLRVLLFEDAIRVRNVLLLMMLLC